MRTLLFANNRLGAAIARYLDERGDLAALVLHPEARRKAGPDLSRLAVPTATWPDVPETDGIECVLSVLFGFKLSPEILAIASWKALNLHPGLLPFNRGAAPNVWPLVDRTPAGTTLHVMEPTIDTGAVLCQQEVAVEPTDTAETLYLKLEAASLAMFCAHWPTVRSLPEVPQPTGGTTHRASEVDALVLTPQDVAVLDKVRARQFGPYAISFEIDGERFEVRVDVRRAN